MLDTVLYINEMCHIQKTRLNFKSIALSVLFFLFFFCFSFLSFSLRFSLWSLGWPRTNHLPCFNLLSVWSTSMNHHEAGEALLPCLCPPPPPRTPTFLSQYTLQQCQGSVWQACIIVKAYCKLWLLVMMSDFSHCETERQQGTV